MLLCGFWFTCVALLSSFSQFSIMHPNEADISTGLVDALQLLKLPLLSLNYDTLLESALNMRFPISARFPLTHKHLLRSGRMQLYWAGTPAGRTAQAMHETSIVHIHGLFTEMSSDLDGFVLSDEEYLDKDHLVAFQAFLLQGVCPGWGGSLAADSKQPAPHGLLFIGCKGTLVDAHFEYLFGCQGHAVRQGWYGAQAPPEHLWLVREGDAAFADGVCAKYASEAGVLIHVVVYGASDDDLPAFLTALLP
jgi:hypothetical protein